MKIDRTYINEKIMYTVIVTVIIVIMITATTITIILIIKMIIIIDIIFIISNIISIIPIVISIMTATTDIFFAAAVDFSIAIVMTVFSLSGSSCLSEHTHTQ